MDATQANAEPSKSDGMEISPEVSRSVENDGTNNEVVQNSEASPAGFDADLASVDSPEALAALMARVTQEPPEGDEGDTATTAEAATPESGEAQSDPQPPKSQAAQGDEDEEDDAPLDLAKLPTRARLQFREDDEVGRLAATLKKRNKDWTLEEAMANAKRQLGHKDAPAPVADEPVTAQPAAQADAKKDETTVAGIEEKMKQLRAEKRKASSEVDLDRVAELDDQLDTLRDQLIEAKVAAKTGGKPGTEKAGRQDTEAQMPDPAARAEYDAKFDASLDRARTFYPDIQDANSPFARRMAELDAMLQEKKDPLFDSPDKPFRVAAMVAAELGVAPRNTSVQAKPGKTGAAPRSVAPIASGDSRTSTARTQSAPTVAAIQGLQSPDDLEAFLAQVGGTRF